MSIRDSVAKKVRLAKEAHPERYCKNKACLWSHRSGPCPKHEIHPGAFISARDDYDPREDYTKS